MHAYFTIKALKLTFLYFLRADGCDAEAKQQYNGPGHAARCRSLRHSGLMCTRGQPRVITERREPENWLRESTSRGADNSSQCHKTKTPFSAADESLFFVVPPTIYNAQYRTAAQCDTIQRWDGARMADKWFKMLPPRLLCGENSRGKKCYERSSARHLAPISSNHWYVFAYLVRFGLLLWWAFLSVQFPSYGLGTRLHTVLVLYIPGWPGRVAAGAL